MIDPDYRLHCHAEVECCSQAEVSQLTTNLARNIRDQLRQQAENIQFTKQDILAKFDAELQDAQERFISYITRLENFLGHSRYIVGHFQTSVGHFLD